jgi:hypothetical protein
MLRLERTEKNHCKPHRLELLSVSWREKTFGAGFISLTEKTKAAVFKHRTMRQFFHAAS